MKKNSPFAVILMTILLISCQKQETSPPVETGTLHLDIGLYISVHDVNNALKSTNQTEEFRVTIFRGDGSVAMTFDNALEMPDTIELGIGDYYVEAHSENNFPAAFENPYYFGASDVFTIGSNIQQTVMVNCELANTIVSVTYSDNIKDGFSDYFTTVSTSLGSLLYGSDETRPGYFQTSPLEILVELAYLKPDGTGAVRSLSGSIADALPNRHYEILVDASIDEGMASFQILLDSSGLITEVIEINEDSTTILTGPVDYGDLLITEIMYNPAALSDSDGEWIEIYNNSARPVNLQNLVVARDDANSHSITDSIELSPGTFFVLMRADSATMAARSYIYGSDISLSNTGAVLSIYNEGSETGPGSLIFSVDYGAAGFPDGSGASISLNPDKMNASDALSGTSWCTSTSPFTTGDLGTPGVANDICQ